MAAAADFGAHSRSNLSLIEEAVGIAGGWLLSSLGEVACHHPTMASGWDQFSIYLPGAAFE